MSEETKPTANEVQVGGDHYKKLSIQTWDFIAANRLDFFQGNIVKYVTRWKEKGGLEDLRKAYHYLDKYIELQQSPEITTGPGACLWCAYMPRRGACTCGGKYK